MNYPCNNSNDDSEAVDDGWGSDLEIDDDDIMDNELDGGHESNNNNNSNTSTGSDMDYHAITPITTNRKIVSVDLNTTERAATTTAAANLDSTVPNDGWGMDDDFDLDVAEDTDDTAGTSSIGVMEAEKSYMIHPHTETIHPHYYEAEQQQQLAYGDTSKTSRSPFTKLEYELHDYIVSIPQVRITYLKKLLQERYSTAEKAIELYQYYMKRPQLLQYTLDKELSRLDYTVITSTRGERNSYPSEVTVVQDKEEIRQILSALHDNNYNDSYADDSALSLSICGRCANQSILVDIIQAMSPSSHSNDNDMVLLPSQYMCSAVASHCHFTIDLIKSCVVVKSYFHISLPLLNQRWNIGQIQMNIHFYCPQNATSQQSPLPPRVEFHVEDYKELIDVVDILDNNTDEVYSNNLRQCATIIRELSMIGDEDTLNQQQQDLNRYNTTNSATVDGIMNFRDAYVNELLTTTDVVVDGMKSAWQDFDTATGLVSKFKKLPSLLPSVDPIVYDEYDTGMHANITLSHAQQQQNEDPYRNYNDFVTQPSHQQHKPQSSRPTSLLGGFVRSLAQSVTLPQEDPSIYQEWEQQQRTFVPPTVSTTMSQGDISNTIPRLYNVETPSQIRTNISSTMPANRNVDGTIPRLYNMSYDKPSDQIDTIDPLHLSEKPSETFRIAMEHDTHTNADVHLAPTMTNVMSQNMSNVNKVIDLGTQQAPNGWDDDIDLTDMDDSCNDTDENTYTCVAVNEEVSSKGEPDILPTKHHSNVVPTMDWVYDPVTDIIPTRTRYRNPICGSRDLRYI